MDYLSKLDKLRQKKGMTRCDLARKSGLADNTIYNWYNDRQCMPTIDVLIRVCETLNITISELFSDESKGEISIDKIHLLKYWDCIEEEDKVAVLHIVRSLVKVKKIIF